MRTERTRLTSPALKASVRVGAAGVVGLAVGLGVAFVAPWQYAVMLGWDVAAAIFVGWTWWTIRGLDAEQSRRLATREDDSRLAADLVLVSASVASLAGVAVLLLKAAESTGFARAATIALAVASVVASWFSVHTVFTLRYAHLYYLDGAGIDFHGGGPPNYADFAYVAFTVGMTFQVSDSEVTTGRMRATVLRHSLLSYVFGIAVIALTINVVAGMLKP